jgi:hypothetical protein
MAPRGSSCVPSRRARTRPTELKRGILFCRLDPRFADLASCVEAIRFDLDRLVDTARRVRPEQENLFCAVSYDRAAWEGAQSAIDQWVRRRYDPVHAVVPPQSHLGGQRGDVL